MRKTYQNRHSNYDTQSHLLFDAAQIPMLIINKDTGSIIDANNAALMYYGYTHDQFLHLKVTDLNQLTEDEVLAEMERAAQQQRNHFFFIHKLANGDLRDVEVHSGLIQTNDQQYLYSVIHDITARRAAERKLSELNRDFITLLENTSDFIYFKGIDSRFRFCSQALANSAGHDSGLDMCGKTDIEVFPPEVAKLKLEDEFPVLNQGKPLLNKIVSYHNKEGQVRWMSTNKWPVIGENKSVVGLFGISRDVTQQQEAQEQLKIAANVFQNVSDGIIITDAKGTIVQVNNAFCRLSGYMVEEVIGRTPSFLTSGHHDDVFFQNMWKSLIHEKSWEGDIWNRHKQGGLFASRTSINSVVDHEDNVINYIGAFTDITLQLRRFEEVERMAYHDALTSLPNRILFNDRLNQALRQADRSKGIVGLCFLDLDKFKPVNDTYGHKVGNLLLMEVARRIQEVIREGDTVARLGGDEFALVLSSISTVAHLEEVLDRVLDKCREPFTLQQHSGIKVSASIGVCVYPDQKATAEELLKAADTAMYQAKKSGRNKYCFYS